MVKINQDSLTNLVPKLVIFHQLLETMMNNHGLLEKLITDKELTVKTKLQTMQWGSKTLTVKQIGTITKKHLQTKQKLSWILQSLVFLEQKLLIQQQPVTIQWTSILTDKKLTHLYHLLLLTIFVELTLK